MNSAQAIHNTKVALDPLMVLANSTCVLLVTPHALLNKMPRFIQTLAQAYDHLQPLSGTGKRLPIVRQSRINEVAMDLNADQVKVNLQKLCGVLKDRMDIMTDDVVAANKQEEIQAWAILAQSSIVDGIETLHIANAVLDAEVNRVVNIADGLPFGTKLRVVGGTDRPIMS